MKSIIKYLLPLHNSWNMISSHEVFRSVHVELIDDTIYLWAIVDITSAYKEQQIRVFSSHEDLPVNLSANYWYIGTVFERNVERHVFHYIPD